MLSEYWFGSKLLRKRAVGSFRKGERKASVAERPRRRAKQEK